MGLSSEDCDASTHTSAVADMLDRYLDQHRDRFLSELRELCAIPSEATDPSALDSAARWCGERLVAAGAASRELRVDGAPALVVGEAGEGKRTLICVQHYDVQPAVPLDLWRTPPYEPAVRDGAVFARGVDDNKGHLLLRIQALETYRAIHGELPLHVRFLIEGEEESGSPNLARLLELDATLTDGDGALKEGGAIDSAGRPQLLLGGKGIFYVELRVRTDAERAHLASLPFESDVVKRLYAIDAFAWGRSDAEARMASVYEPTCNICGLVSGFTDEGTKTVIPSEAMVKIDFRLVPEQDPARIRTLLRAHLDRRGFTDVELIAKEGTRPYRGRIDDPLVRAAQAVSEEEIGKPALLIPSSGGTSPMWQVCGKRSLANVTLGMGHPGSGAHAPNEHILLDNYWKALRATVALFRRYAEQA
jgi:acetylornithine deacetylase/succinyl-diaminopimelate desuccinylase-like protein